MEDFEKRRFLKIMIKYIKYLFEIIFEITFLIY